MSETRKVTLTRVEMVERCADIMRELRWVRGKTGKVLAHEWGVSEDVMKHVAAEASRRISSESGDLENAKPMILSHLAVALEEASKTGNPIAVSKVADVYAKIVGANAPSKHEHSFSGLSDEELQAKAAELIAAMKTEGK